LTELKSAVVKERFYSYLWRLCYRHNARWLLPI